MLVMALALSILITACSDRSNTDSTPDTTTEAEASNAGTAAAEDEPGNRAADQTPDDPDRDGTGRDEPAEDEAPRFEVAPAQWTDCDTGLQCATVAVPRDHDDPMGRTIDLAMVRVPAGDDARGSIFINLGGPGASAINSVRNGFTLDDETMAGYHLVGLDPRGIGASAPLRCGIDLTVGPRPDFSPDTEAERTELDDQARSIAEECGRLDGEFLPHIGTDSVVADLDLLRQAVGDERLNYLGLSYGTVIGLRYAERHPELVNRMVLDGVVDPSFTLIDLLRQQAGEFERSFAVLDEACGTALRCPDGGVIAGYDRVSATLEQDGPVGQVGQAELEVAALIAMYSERLWPRLSNALIDAENGDYASLESLHDLYVGGVGFTAYLAVSCIDTPQPNGGAAWDAVASEFREIAPRFGSALANEVRGCAYWPVEATEAPGPVAAEGAPPMLVLSTTGDAATPVTNAVTVAEGLTGAGLVLVDDEGHTAYGRNFCVVQIVADYFDTGRVPTEIHRC